MEEVVLKNGDRFPATFVGAADNNLIIQTQGVEFMAVASAFSDNENTSLITYQSRTFENYKMSMIVIEPDGIRVNLLR